MTRNADQFAYVDDKGRCATTTSDHLVVLACSVSASHDEGFRKSRWLATKFCESVSEAAAKSRLDREILAAVSVKLFSPEEWTRWGLSFCVVERQDRQLKAFNCGASALASISDGQTIRRLLTPQTLGRKLRREGVSNVPAYAEQIAATMAGAGLKASEIDEVELEVVHGTAMVATADPRLVESLSDLVAQTYSSKTALVETLGRALDALNNPVRSFVLWFF